MEELQDQTTPTTSETSTAAAMDSGASDPMQTDSESSQRDEYKCNLIVNYIPNVYSEEDLRQLFAPYGEIESCKLIVDKQTGHSLGYGFVKYFKEEDAERAIEELSGRQVENKRLKVALARPSSPSIQNTNLYISNLPPHLNAEALEDIFRPYGDIVESRVLVDHQTGSSKGVGFVRFSTHDQALEAIRQVNNMQLPGAEKPLLVKFAENKTKSKRQQQQQYPTAMYQQMQQRQLAAMYMQYNQMAYMAAARGMSPPVMSGAGMQRPGYGYEAYYRPDMAGVPQTMQYPQQYQNMNTAGGNSVDNSYCLFVYHLPAGVNEEYLYQMFSPFGQVTGVKVVVDSNTGYPKGYGFVNYATLEEAQQAIMNMNGFQIGNKRLLVSFKTQKQS